MDQQPGAIVWLNQSEAKVFFVGPGGAAPERHHRREGGRVRDDREYFEAILASVVDAGSWLIAGPDHTRHDLEKYLDGHAEDLRGRLVGVEQMAAPDERSLSAVATQLA